ncbi:hypothetical protein B4Q13_19050 [Lacticaseibacillus rhamnosus]
MRRARITRRSTTTPSRNANTISHQFIHRPFFQHRAANRLFAAYLSVLLGFPHSLWRDRHLSHHGLLRHRRARVSVDLVLLRAGREAGAGKGAVA